MNPALFILKYSWQERSVSRRLGKAKCRIFFTSPERAPRSERPPVMCLSPPAPARIFLLSYSSHGEEKKKNRKRSSFGKQKPSSASVNTEQLWRRGGLKHRHTRNNSRLIICCTCSSSTIRPPPPCQGITGINAKYEFCSSSITEHKGALVYGRFMSSRGHRVRAAALCRTTPQLTHLLHHPALFMYDV